MENSIPQDPTVETKPEWQTPELIIETVASVTKNGFNFAEDGISGS